MTELRELSTGDILRLWRKRRAALDGLIEVCDSAILKLTKLTDGRPERAAPKKHRKAYMRQYMAKYRAKAK